MSSGPRTLPPTSTAASSRFGVTRSEEHTSELQSLAYLVCRLLLEKKKNTGYLESSIILLQLSRSAPLSPSPLWCRQSHLLVANHARRTRLRTMHYEEAGLVECVR